MGDSASTYSWKEFKQDWPKSPRLRRFVYFGIPTGTAIILSTCIVWNKSFKEYVESISPQAVALVRDYWGLQEENIHEDYRVKRSLAAQSKGYQLRVRDREGNNILSQKVSGSTSLADIWKSNDAILKNRSYALENIELTCESDFIEEIKEPILQSKYNVTELQNKYNRKAPISFIVDSNSLWESPKSIYQYEKDLEDKAKSKNETQADSTNNNAIQNYFQPVGYKSLFTCIHNQFYLGETILANQMKPSTFLVDFNFSQAHNFIVRGVKLYNQFGNRYIVNLSKSKLPADVIAKSRECLQNPSAPAASSSKSELQEAEMQVSFLQSKIQSLKEEMRYGVRDIDSTLKEISLLESEIVKIKRTKINTFYFF